MAKRAQKPDLVYFVKDSQYSTELIYSLRSVARNLRYRKVWIYGGCPFSIRPDEHIKIEQVGDNKWDRTKSMYRAMALNKDITDDFILMNDDFYVMKKVEAVKYAHRGLLESHISVLKGAFGTKLSDYTYELEKTLRTLKNYGIEHPLSYELHIPMMMNRHRLLEIMGAFPDSHATRTIYGNYFNVKGEERDDCKVHKWHRDFDKKSEYLSSDDTIWVQGNSLKEYLEDKFKKPSKYELAADKFVRVRACRTYYDKQLEKTVTMWTTPWETTKERAMMLTDRGLVEII